MLFSFSPCGQTYFSCLLYDHQIKYFVCCRDRFSPSFLPQVGMEGSDVLGYLWISFATDVQSGCVLQVCMNVFCLLKMSYHDLYVVSGI
jgi:hypothetical protein